MKFLSSSSSLSDSLLSISYSEDSFPPSTDSSSSLISSSELSWSLSSLPSPSPSLSKKFWTSAKKFFIDVRLTAISNWAFTSFVVNPFKDFSICFKSVTMWTRGIFCESALKLLQAFFKLASSLFKPSGIFDFSNFWRIILSENKVKMSNEDFTALAETKLCSSLGINHFENYSFLKINKSLKTLFISLKIV